MKIHSILILLCSLCCSASSLLAQNDKQKGLLWQITGNGLKKPSYVYGTMHVSRKIAFHLGDSFYIALSKCDMVALEQDLDSVIHLWITDNDYDDPEDAQKVYPRSHYDILGLYDFTLSSYNRKLLQRKLSAEVREVNYLLVRGDKDDFEEDTWLDLYIYQIAKKLGKGFTGVEGFAESRELVKKANKEPKDNSKKKPKRFSYKLRNQVAESYRKGDIFMIDSIDRLTESDHYLEYMLYRRNANMVRRMDSIMRLGKTLFTGVGCSHLPGGKGVLQMLIEKGYKVRPVQSIALEKSKLAKKYENMLLKHKYQSVSSDDGLITAKLPTRLTKVNNTTNYSSYLSPDLANGFYYQIEKISCNNVFSGKSPKDVLMVVDTLIFENLPGEIVEKKAIVSNGFEGMEVITRLKTGDLNRFQILASPFNIYIIRMSAKKEFALSSHANEFFKTLQINEGGAGNWRRINSPDSVFSLELPISGKEDKLSMPFRHMPFYEHLIYEKSTGNSYLIKQEDIQNSVYMEEDTFELDLMARSFALTDNFSMMYTRHFDFKGYHAMDAEFLNKMGDKMLARFVICGTRFIMFVLKPGSVNNGYNDRYFTGINFNGKPSLKGFEYYDTTSYFKVNTPVTPLLPKKMSRYYYGDDESDAGEKQRKEKYKGVYNQVYFTTGNSNEFVTVSAYRYGYYESQDKTKDDYYSSWSKTLSLKLISEKKEMRKGIEYVTHLFTDTNTNRRLKVMHVHRGQIRYFINAFIDTVSGENELCDMIMSSFDVSDTLIDDDIFQKKGYRFFKDFTSSDSLIRKASIKYCSAVSFDKKDIKDICNVIDTISMKGDAAKLRILLLHRLSDIDSAQDLIVPYLTKLYKRFSDTAYMQIHILKAIASQESAGAYQSIKPILASDVPISDNDYEMSSILEQFWDTLKLTKLILPEIIELTNLNEYRNSAYGLLSVMKDSGIIQVNDYAGIHEKLVRETKIEYKRLMASLTKGKSSYSNDWYASPYEPYDEESIMNTLSFGNMMFDYEDYGSRRYKGFLLSNILDLSLPLKDKYPVMQEIVGKILRITDNDLRISLLPVLIKYNIHFEDSVYKTLATGNKTRKDFYKVMYEGKQLDKFPKAFMNHHSWISACIYGLSTSYNEVDTIDFYLSRKMRMGKDSCLVYAYRYRYKDDDDWRLYMSESLPCDTNKLNKPEETFLFDDYKTQLNTAMSIDEQINKLLFISLLRYKRTHNGGYFNSYSNSLNRYDYESYYDYY